MMVKSIIFSLLFFFTVMFHTCKCYDINVENMGQSLTLGTDLVNQKKNVELGAQLSHVILGIPKEKLDRPE